jgi:hypothetical protein
MQKAIKKDTWKQSCEVIPEPHLARREERKRGGKGKRVGGDEEMRRGGAR